MSNILPKYSHARKKPQPPHLSILLPEIVPEYLTGIFDSKAVTLGQGPTTDQWAGTPNSVLVAFFLISNHRLNQSTSK